MDKPFMAVNPDIIWRYFLGENEILNGPDSLTDAEKEFRVKHLRKLYIEPTTECNFSCSMCARNFWDEKVFRHMTMETFEKAIDGANALKSVRTVFFGGFGEPLLHPDIAEMVRRAGQSGFRTELITNGSLLDEKMIISLLDAGINAVWVSYDGSESSSPGHGSFGADSVFRNLQLLSALRILHRPETFCELNLSCVISRSNAKHLQDIISAAQTLRAQNVLFSHILPYDESCLDELCYRFVADTGAGIKTKNRLNIQVTLPFSDFSDPDLSAFLGARMLDRGPLILGNTQVARQFNRCPFIEDGDTFVRADGEVCPCMALLHSGPVYFFEQKRHIQERSFGNILRTPLEEIWNSTEYTEFRERVISFSFSPCIRCGGCEYREKNEEDCMGNTVTACGACFWAAGVVRCP